MQNISEHFKETKIIVFQSIKDSEFSEKPQKIEIKRKFKIYHLLALNRTKLKDLISQYNSVSKIADNTALILKILSDLENLNIHRTPFNTITLLKASEKYYSESPVNRTAMIEMVLFVLFNLDSLPTYNTKPDRNDCEFVLGYFCEFLLLRENYFFTKQEFIIKSQEYCTKKLLKLDVEIVFDILVSNNILIAYEEEYTFRSNYWTYYFLAKRMSHSTDFKNYILTEKRYTSFPEVIEFYTGIERNSDETLKILSKDLDDTCQIVIEKLGFPAKMNPLKLLKWHPSLENIDSVKKELGDNVSKSNLPEKVKDQYADKSYNQLQPYNQTIYRESLFT